MKSLRIYSTLVLIVLAVVSCKDKDSDNGTGGTTKALTACFSFTPQSPTNGQTVTFTNCSENATRYLWDFGDLASSTDANPTHTYAQDGTYNIILHSYDDNGGNESVSQTIVVKEGVNYLTKVTMLKYDWPQPTQGLTISVREDSPSGIKYTVFDPAFDVTSLPYEKSVEYRLSSGTWIVEAGEGSNTTEWGTFDGSTLQPGTALNFKSADNKGELELLIELR